MSQSRTTCFSYDIQLPAAIMYDVLHLCVSVYAIHLCMQNFDMYGCPRETRATICISHVELPGNDIFPVYVRCSCMCICECISCNDSVAYVVEWLTAAQLVVHYSHISRYITQAHYDGASFFSERNIFM